MFCRFCGSSLPDDSTFCHSCGKSLAIASPSLSVNSTGMVAQAVAPAMIAVQKTETEKTFLATAAATVTNSRIIVPERTYAMAGITSVASTVIPAKRGWPIFIALIGLILLLGREPGAGVLLIVIGVAWAIALKDKHAVSLRSASGEIHAVISTDSDYVSKIVRAVNEAIVYRN